MMRRNNGRRILALMMAMVMTAVCGVPVRAASIDSGVAPTCDEAYYATLDYYGNLLEGSVVKSYALNGATSFTDYGVYDEVVNLTDSTPVAMGTGSASFRFEQVPSHFYFEGKTQAPFRSLPWTVTLRYTLNGVPARAEDLAGKTGVVEILLDVVPNEGASDYARYNYTLEAMALFNEDDILSLEADGAQVQLVGNLRTVLFMCLPGEERHFTIRVGSDDFSFGGMTILMVPATLAQLEEIAKLSQRKDDLEEDYRALSGSLDALLDALNDVQDGLYASADGLDQLNAARGTFSAGKGTLYSDAGVLREDLSNIADLLEPVEQRTLALSQTITDSKALLNDMTDTAVSLRSQLEELERALEGLEDGTGDVKRVIRTAADLKNSLRSLQRVLGSNGSGISVNLPTDNSKNLALVKLAHSAYKETDPTTFMGTMGQLAGSTGVAPSEEEIAKLTALYQNKGNMTFEQFCGAFVDKDKAKDMSDLWTIYSGGNSRQAAGVSGPAAGMSFTTGSGLMAGALAAGALENNLFLVDAAAPGESADNGGAGSTDGGDAGSGDSGDAGSTGSGDAGSVDSGGAGNTDGSDTSAPDSGEDSIQPPNGGAGGTGDAGASDGGAAGGAQGSGDNPVADVIVDRLDSASKQLNALQSQLNSTLNSISRATGSVVGDLAVLCGELDDLTDLLDDAEDLSAALRQSSGKIRDILEDVDALQTVLNEYEPVLQEGVANMGSLSTAAVSALRDLETLLADTESLMKSSGRQLDSGTKQALQGLASTLRQTARAMAATGDVRDAKTTINDIIEDTWHEYTGDVNNILLMDAEAETVSLTDSRNPSPSSVQVLIRTQEIKTEDAEQTAEPLAQKEATTFWGRIVQMFKDFWNAVTSIFRGKEKTPNGGETCA